jgi:hypothetical protein
MTRSPVILPTGILLAFAGGFALAWFLRGGASPKVESHGEPPPPVSPADERARRAVLPPGVIAVLPRNIQGWYPKRFEESVGRLGLTEAELAEKDLARLGNNVMERSTSFLPAAGDLAIRELCDRLPRPWRVAATMQRLIGLVFNGGFRGYFFNAGGMYNSWLLDDLDYLGAGEHRRIVARALEVHHTNLLGTEGEGHEYDTLERTFWEVKPDLAEILGAFVKQHPELFRVPGQKGG